MDFFKVSKEDIEKSKSNKSIQFKHGETFTMMIEELKEITEEGKEKLIVTGKITSGEHTGKKHSIFVFKSSMSFFVDLLLAFFKEEVITAGKVKPEDIVGRQFETTVSISNYQGKDYTNYRKVKAVSNVPTMSIEAVQDQQVQGSKDLF